MKKKPAFSSDVEHIVCKFIPSKMEVAPRVVKIFSGSVPLDHYNYLEHQADNKIVGKYCTMCHMENLAHVGYQL